MVHKEVLGPQYQDDDECLASKVRALEYVLHLIIGGPMPVTAESLREMANFMDSGPSQKKCQCINRSGRRDNICWDCGGAVL